MATMLYISEEAREQIRFLAEMLRITMKEVVEHAVVEYRGRVEPELRRLAEERLLTAPERMVRVPVDLAAVATGRERENEEEKEKAEALVKVYKPTQAPGSCIPVDETEEEKRERMRVWAARMGMDRLDPKWVPGLVKAGIVAGAKDEKDDPEAGDPPENPRL